jgi:hypothetical protein
LEAIFGSIILQFLGASAKWVIYFILNKYKGKKTIPFKKFWKGRKAKHEMDYILDGWSNIWVGILVILALSVILVTADFD